jgi:ubiquinone/menaquinone biosynthesis C-methylase UbiE
MALDVRLLTERLQDYPPASTTVVDFGGGTGRVARHLLPHGYSVLNVDLSQHMLVEARRQARSDPRAGFVRSNLVELQWLRDGSIHVGVCLFSSIGMIRGREHRVKFLTHARRALKPGGLFMLHVHNRHRSWLDPQGPWWLTSTYLRNWIGNSCEPGDREYPYRGLPRMFLHIYSRSELQADLRAAGFEAIEICPIRTDGAQLLSPRRPLEFLRAGGYFAFCLNA